MKDFIIFKSFLVKKHAKQCIVFVGQNSFRLTLPLYVTCTPCMNVFLFFSDSFPTEIRVNYLKGQSLEFGCSSICRYCSQECMNQFQILLRCEQLKLVQVMKRFLPDGIYDAHIIWYIRKMLNILIKLNKFDSTYALLRC